MLGAQARAAELAAASAAKQRQVSRELEERQMPANPAVSLSAFTKPQPTTTRNKGNKTWKPLILDDIVESSDDASASDPVVSTPSNADRITAKEASDKKIPTAPRAMATGRSLSTVVAYPQPPVAQPSPAMPVRGGPQGNGRTHHGGLPTQVFAQNMYLPWPTVVGIPLNNVVPFEPFGSMMVPDDMSPTKQEQKFSMLENVPLPHTIHGQELSHLRMAQPGMIQYRMIQYGDPVSHRTPQTFGDDQHYLWDDCSHDSYYPGYQTSLQGQAQGLGGFYDDESDGGFTSAQMPQAPAQRSAVTQARFDTTANQLSSLPSRQDFSQQPTLEPPSQYQQPYNTERAMKECVNKLKEKAKDGKTVLHNPESHREPPQTHITNSEKSILPKPAARKLSSNPQRPVPWEVRSKDSSQRVGEWEVMPPPADQTSDGAWSFTNNSHDRKGSIMIRPAPGLPVPSNFGPPKLFVEDSRVAEPDASTTPQVGSAEWMRLAPITAVERNRVRRCMARAAKSITNETPLSSIAVGQCTENLAEIREWFHSDARGERLLRQQVDLSAQAHATNVIANMRARNGGELPEHFKTGQDDGLAATLVLGNVACNLQTYLVGNRKSVEQRKNFHRVKGVPDWCTERGGLILGGLGGGDSYFDGATGGFYGAPVRVARDPRFRPQMKEGMKMKPEEEWKNRHEMYGRRVM
jgi:hypothetical protein